MLSLDQPISYLNVLCLFSFEFLWHFSVQARDTTIQQFAASPTFFQIFISHFWIHIVTLKHWKFIVAPSTSKVSVTYITHNKSIMSTAFLFLSLLSFVKFFGPSNEKKEWTRLSRALKERLAPLHQDIGRASTDFPEYTETLGDRLSKEIKDFLLEHIEFFAGEASTSSSN